MSSRLHDLLHLRSQAQTVEQAFAEIAGQATSLGFEHCAFGLRQTVPVSCPRTMMWNNYPIAWQKRYEECGYLHIDPIVDHGIRNFHPIMWSDALFHQSRGLWEEARSHGLQHGWSLSTRNRDGTIGMLSVCRSAEPITTPELHCIEPLLVWLTHCAHLAIAPFEERPVQAISNLTAREIEVLKWTADGKTSWEVAKILNVTERTVNYHISNACTKLSAPNKTAAVFRAALLGLLSAN